MSARRVPLLLLPLVALLVLASCADRAPSPATPSSAAGGDAFPVELRPEGAPPVTIDRRPERIVSLSPSTTETLFAVGAGEQVVAVDSASTYPPEAPKTSLSGLNLDPEAIAGYNPDLVIVESDLESKLADALAKTGVTTLVLPAPKSLDAAYEQFALVGKATGHRAEGEDLARRTREEIGKLVADTPKPDERLSYYHELDPSLYSATSATFIGQVYGLFGLTNIADQGDPEALGGYPQLSAERILRADPDLIFLADSKCCGQNADTVAARPGWDTLSAVRHDRVFALNDDIASRWSPRLVELVRTVAEAVAPRASR
ncbi:ABC transporter substrate-binding protein [Prauserella muralis]|uniref:ABC transporter substrate-binding protein n=1 Tax=Prauserella muralis TaxID=588067 RepID=A0A2V4AK59_9PSEU|nr:ABC transporter substrate-binding protein [Prauserella muralis]PXY20647.1 ABC transporter substrate-binding protein [Prauserella muralis]TWE29637.1 iron complex transport system substrate-binding protein [Prauserella muralis]